MYAVQIYRKSVGDESPCSGGRKLLLGLCKDGGWMQERDLVLGLSGQDTTRNEV